jgi:phytoene desaturase
MTVSLLRERRAPRVVVVGSGLGGLAVAVRLLAAGFHVTVLEQGDRPGGRAGRIRESGFTFDTGPSLITMPDVLDDLFATAGASLSDHLHLVPLDPYYRIDYEGDGRSFLFSGDRGSMQREIARFSVEDAERYDAFLSHSRRVYEEAILAAGRRPFLRFTDFLGLVPSMLRLGALRSVQGFVGRYFRDPHVQQAFGFHPLFIGGDPFRVPAVYAALAYLQIAGGVWYSRGGVYSVVEALSCFVRSGGRLVTGCRVTEILHDGGSVRGVRTADGDVVEADYVISNADVVETQRSLLGREARPPALTMSCYLLYLGTSRPFPQLEHHTLLVGRDYRGFIHDVTRGGRLPESLSLYVHAPSRTEPAMARAGGESITVLLPVPHLSADKQWEQVEPRLRECVLDVLESPDGLRLSGLRDSILVERSWTPLDFRDQLGAVQGNAFGPEPTLRQSAYFRQPNQDRRLDGMYYVGAGTHPGAGIPGVLMTAEVTANLVVTSGSEH